MKQKIKKKLFELSDKKYKELAQKCNVKLIDRDYIINYFSIFQN